MIFYIPTYDECKKIVHSNPIMYFYETKHIIDSYNISIFGYRYATYNNFMLPIIDQPTINALELKGISFVFDDDNSLYNRYIMLNKFWELDQYTHCNINNYIGKKVKTITEKLDGFLVTFIMLPSGHIISQTKKGFYTKDNIKANEYLNKKNYYNFIKRCLINNIQPIFEIIGEKLYVSYTEENLILIKLRSNTDGKYLDISNIDEVPIVKEYKKDFSEILDMRKHLVNLEGWIVHFDDDTLLKVKTIWWTNEKNGS